MSVEKKKEIHIAPEDVILKLSEMAPEDRPVPPAAKPVVSEVKTVMTEAKPIVSEVESAETEAKPIVSEVKPAETEVKPIVSEVKPLDEEDDDEDDIDFLDDPDLDEEEDEAARLIKEKEELLALKKEKKELRKQKRKEFFSNLKQMSLKDLWDRRLDVEDFFLEKKEQIKNFKLGKENEEDGEEGLDLNARIKIEQNKQKIRLVAIGTACVLLITVIGLYYQFHVFHNFKVITSQERQDDNATEYVTLKGYRLKCNPNGVTCVNRKSEIVWNTTFSMQSPIVDKCGDLVAVGSQRGNEIYIFDENGLISSFAVEHVLTKMKVTKQGDVAVVLEDGQVTWINVYNKWGKLLIRNKTTMPESGYPLDMDISSNGYKMMVSFLGINDDIESRVAFFNFSAVGQDSEGRLVNEECYTGHVIPEVKFMDGNYAIAFRDDGVTVFRGQQIPEECNEIQISQEIISEFSNEKYFGFVTESDEEDSEHKFKMVIYRENGARCGSVYFNFEYTNIVMNGNQVILYNNTSMMIYTVTGKLQFSGDYNKQILKVIPTSSARKFNILTDDTLDTIKIK